MEAITLQIPDGIVEALPDDDGTAAKDMARAVAGWEDLLNRRIEAAEDDEAVTGATVDLVERFEDRWEQYDEFVAELRAWGQSPIYAMAWRDLHAALVNQLYEHPELGPAIDRERHARVFADGIRRRR